MSIHRRQLIGMIAMSVCLGLVSCAAPPSSPGTSTTPAQSLLKGTRGAAHFSDGFVQIGTGGKTVDVYLDPMCPYCRAFEEQHLPMLLNDAQAGRGTLRVHPLAILDRLSNGTNYSTRAAASIVDVAANHPKAIGVFIKTLFDHQPAENSDGLTDQDLAALIQATTQSKPASPQKQATYRSWVGAMTQRSSVGPLTTTADIKSIQQVPTVIVNGHLFLPNAPGNSTFEDFYASR